MLLEDFWNQLKTVLFGISAVRGSAARGLGVNICSAMDAADVTKSNVSLNRRYMNGQKKVSLF